MQVAGDVRQLANPDEIDSGTSGFFRWANGGVACGGVKKDGYNGHPPYKTGAGAVWSVWPVELPSAKEGCRLRFSLGMSSVKSDGVGLRVFIGEDTPETTVYAVNQTETGRWIEHEEAIPQKDDIGSSSAMMRTARAWSAATSVLWTGPWFSPMATRP